VDHQHVRLSKYMSLLLRHRPEVGNLRPDDAGWIELDDLVRACVAAGRATNRDDVLDVVARSDKQRFELSADGGSIRAAQGHSIDVDLGLSPVPPPTTLFHGTVGRFLDRIRAEGLRSMGRTHVHLSADIETAQRVGSRRGTPVILSVDAAGMSADGFLFFRSSNGVWLVDEVPAPYLRVVQTQTQSGDG
jgi:putative RNA 2'-phosphotransferase